MTEQDKSQEWALEKKLKNSLNASKGGFSQQRFDELMRSIKAYADARENDAKEVAMKAVEARNEFAKQLSELRREWEDKNTEIAELKASLSQAQQMYTDLLVGTTDAIAAKESEIKRLRDVVKRVYDRDRFSVTQIRAELLPTSQTTYPDIFSKILALPDDTSAAYIKAFIHDHIKTA